MTFHEQHSPVRLENSVRRGDVLGDGVREGVDGSDAITWALVNL